MDFASGNTNTLEYNLYTQHDKCITPFTSIPTLEAPRKQIITIMPVSLHLGNLRRTASLHTPSPTPISVSKHFDFDEATYRDRLMLFGLICRPRAWYGVDDHRHVLQPPMNRRRYNGKVEKHTGAQNCRHCIEISLVTMSRSKGNLRRAQNTGTEAGHPLLPHPAVLQRGALYSVSCHSTLKITSQHNGTSPTVAEQKGPTSPQKVTRVENDRVGDGRHWLQIFYTYTLVMTLVWKWARTRVRTTYFPGSFGSSTSSPPISP